MDFEFSSQHEQVRKTIARFVAEDIAPLVAKAEEDEVFPRNLFRKWADLGLLGVRYPEADGGSGFDKISDCIVREEMSRVCQSFASSWSAHTHLALWPIWRAGTLDQPEAIKPDVHIFTRSQVPWLELPKSARVFPAFYKFDEVWPPESLERWRRLTAS